jgi:hypothetical protein
MGPAICSFLFCYYFYFLKKYIKTYPCIGFFYKMSYPYLPDTDTHTRVRAG